MTDKTPERRYNDESSTTSSSRSERRTAGNHDDGERGEAYGTHDERWTGRMDRRHDGAVDSDERGGHRHEHTDCAIGSRPAPVSAKARPVEPPECPTRLDQVTPEPAL